jgi:hypothetical protein
MKHLILLMLTLAHGGHWLAGHTETITIAWPAESGLPASTLHWECKLGLLSLASGTADMPDAAHPATVTIVAPKVRTQTRLWFAYQLKSRDHDTELSSGETEIRVYPDSLVGDFASQYLSKRVVLLDTGDKLLSALKSAKIQASQIPDPSRLALDRPDVLIVAPDQWPTSPLAQIALEPLAKSGAQIILFRQSKIDRLVGYGVAQRQTADGLIWRTDHPLLGGLDADTLSAWTAEAPAQTIQLPPDESALEVGYWKPETSTKLPTPIDALIITRTIGTGRIVFCQLPTDDWQNDPRPQILLHNMLAYAMIRPEPTPPPSQRQPPATAPVPQERNMIYSGAQP